MSSRLVRITTTVSLKYTAKFINGCVHFKDHIEDALIKIYAEQGIAKLKAATPRKTGKTADSWTYEITRTKEGATIDFINTNINDGVNIALILQYGHGTNFGGYVRGIDYINPVLADVFKEFAEGVFAEVRKL